MARMPYCTTDNLKVEIFSPRVLVMENILSVPCNLLENIFWNSPACQPVPPLKTNLPGL
jgi:hypothetical protein